MSVLQRIPLKINSETRTNLNLNAALSQFSALFLKIKMCRKVHLLCPVCGQFTDIDDWMCFRAYARGRPCLIQDLPVIEADEELCEDCEIDELDAENLDMAMFGPQNG